MMRVALCGALGRMGSEVARAIADQGDMTVTVAIESKGHPKLGTRMADAEIVSDLREGIERADVVVDFTNPEGAVAHVTIAAQHKRPAVIGVTALTDQHMERIRAASKQIPIVYGPNMSVGMNLLFQLVSKAAKTLKEGFDFEIVEMHHRMKKDAPSGTAAKIADILTQAMRDSEKVYGRKGMVGERRPQEIGIHAVRGGDVAGEHCVIFAGDGERLEITHRASSRRAFAAGVVMAIRFVITHAPGFYGMDDVLGFT